MAKITISSDASTRALHKQDCCCLSTHVHALLSTYGWRNIHMLFAICYFGTLPSHLILWSCMHGQCMASHQVIHSRYMVRRMQGDVICNWSKCSHAVTCLLLPQNWQHIVCSYFFVYEGACQVMDPVFWFSSCLLMLSNIWQWSLTSNHVEMSFISRTIL
jgi:hypothetical protein